MQYDPVKKSLGNFFNQSVFLRKTFYNLLDLLLLRSWHIHKGLKRLTPNPSPKERGIESASIKGTKGLMHLQ